MTRVMKSTLVISFIFLMSIIPYGQCRSQSNYDLSDSVKKTRTILEEASVHAAQKEIEITVRSVEITNFPKIKIFIEAYNKIGEPLDSLSPDNLFVYENGVSKKVLTVDKIPVSQEVTVDFVFVIDVTGSMQKYINDVRNNISNFTSSLVRRGIDYRLGLILFGDDIEKIYQPTDNVLTFLDWLAEVHAKGGGDEKENALEALEAATKIKYRFGASRVAVLITDAPYHQQGEEGDGVTNQTTESIIKSLVQEDTRAFCIVPPRLESYGTIARKTRGNFFDIDYPFSTILDNFSNQLTNLYALTYRSDEGAIPDSIEIALFNSLQGKLVRRTIPIVELGRKLIIENLLYSTNHYELDIDVPELDILTNFMKSKPNIAVMIEGHTDNVGSHNHNDVLSLKRAESVKNYLVTHGISKDRIKTKGYGKRRPIADNNTEFGRKLNRRTEIVIVSN